MSVINKICAYPVIISWVLGACVVDSMSLAALGREVSLSAVFSDFGAAGFLVLGLLAATLLGYFLGMFTCWPIIRVVCSRLNGAPLKIGDQVVVLSGPLKGRSAQVYEITVGQGGWELARLDLGQEHHDQFTDIFEEYSLLRVARS